MFSKSLLIALVGLSISSALAAPTKGNGNEATCDSAAITTKTVTVTASVAATSAVAASASASSGNQTSGSGSSTGNASGSTGSSSGNAQTGSGSSTGNTQTGSGSGSNKGVGSGSNGATGKTGSGNNVGSATGNNGAAGNNNSGSTANKGAAGNNNTGSNANNGAAGNNNSGSATGNKGAAGNNNTGANKGAAGNNSGSATGNKGAAGNNSTGSATGNNGATANNSTSSANTGTGNNQGSGGQASAGALSTTDITQNATANNPDAQSSLTLDPRVIATGFLKNGQDQPTAGQVASLTSNNNFINFCLTQGNLPITNGQQIKTGSCNPAPIGTIPSVQNMPSAKFANPKNGDTIPANTAFTITMNINNLATGNFVNANENYFAAPQQLNAQGQIIGHTHVVIEALSQGLGQTTVTNPQQFAFFKGVNTAAQNGAVSADVTSGVPAGAYRLCSINSSSNHQPVIVPIAQHGSLDDCVYFTASNNGAGANAGATASNATASAAGANAGAGAAGANAGASAASANAGAAATGANAGAAATASQQAGNGNGKANGNKNKKN